MHTQPRRRILPRHRCLASTLAAILLGGATTGAAAVDGQWQRLRGTTDWPLFGSPLAGTAQHRAIPTRHGATRYVENCNDDGPGSLRAVLTDAGESDTVDLTQLQCARITLATGAIAIQVDNLAIRGKGPAATVIDGGDNDRVFIHYGFGTLTLQELTISGGYYRATGHDVAFGGCIAARSYLSLDHVDVRDCRAVGVGSYGGGTFSYALLAQDSTISGNLASGRLDDATTAGFGGGVYAYVVQLSGSTVSGNRADFQADPRFSSYGVGGGIMTIVGGSIANSTIDANFSQGRGGGIASFSNLLVSNSTISGNRADEEVGGGLFLRWPSALQLYNSTIAFNEAGGDAGGIWLNAPNSTFHSSLVARNRASDPGAGNGQDIGNRLNPYSPGAANAIDGSHNLIGAHGSLLTLPADSVRGDPMLASLAANGGPTRTHALQEGSAAIDAGDNPSGLAFDQRGLPRVDGIRADIGAYEYQRAPPAAQAPTSVPGLSGWAAWLLAIGLGFAAARRHQAEATRARRP